ncbi:LAGLIDADG family homing endonuclease [Streptomyces sp. NPDC050287]|uniref:LAGLIDADG family homing endonuclease n=1 Tax=Streptomyces sp. NPDC050287 TaxID=3365608 RepID=UPI0037AE322A
MTSSGTPGRCGTGPTRGHEITGLLRWCHARRRWYDVVYTDGCVRLRVNPRGTLQGSVEFATVSRRLAEQVSDMLLRLGVTSLIRE